jgi:hypothetical protein
MSASPLLQQMARRRYLAQSRDIEQRRNDSGRGSGNGSGSDSGGEDETGRIQFTFSCPSGIVAACANANVAGGEGLEGEGHLATPMTAEETVEEERTVRRVFTLRKEIRKLQGDLWRERRRRREEASEFSLWRQRCLRAVKERETKFSSFSLLEKKLKGKVEDPTRFYSNPQYHQPSPPNITMSPTEEEVEELHKQVAKLEKDLDNANERITEAETAWKEEIKKVGELEKAAITHRSSLDKVRTEKVKQDRYLETVEQRLKESTEKIDEQTTALTRNRELLAQSRTATKDALDRAESHKKQYDGMVTDLRAMRNRCADLEKRVGISSQELDEFRRQKLIYEDAANDIKQERIRNKALTEEMKKLKQDVNSLGFNPDPRAYRKKSNASERHAKNLEDELADAGNASQDELSGKSASEAESDIYNDQPQYGHLGPLPVIPEVPKPTIITKTVYKNVYIDRPAIVDRPFETSAHNPITCWAQVELNFFILFWAYVATLFSVIARLSRKMFGFLAVKGSTDLGPLDSASEGGRSTDDTQRPPAPPTQDQQRTGYPQNLPAQSDHDQQSADKSKTPPAQSTQDQQCTLDPQNSPAQSNQNQQSTVDPPNASAQPTNTPEPTADTQSPHAQSTPDQLPSPVDLERLRPKLWMWSTIIHPKSLPSAQSTFMAMGFHIMVYAALFFSYSAYTERQLWLAANDSTRSFVHQLLTNPGASRTGISRFLFLLPEEWKRFIDILLWHVVDALNMQVNYPMPG